MNLAKWIASMTRVLTDSIDLLIVDKIKEVNLFSRRTKRKGRISEMVLGC